MTIPLINPTPQTVIRFTKDTENAEGEIVRATAEAAVFDKFPQLGDLHLEGRRYIEVSVEQFIYLISLDGWTPIVPGEED